METTPLVEAHGKIAEYALASEDPKIVRKALYDIASVSRYGFDNLAEDELKLYGIQDLDA